MKVRTGFVSNSSSSSFIIKAQEGFMTVNDVAKYIIANVDYYKYDAELKVLDSATNPDTPVYFSTGGDDTYLRKVEDKIVIVTTQNISFPAFHEMGLGKKDLSKKFYDKFKFIESSYGEDDEYAYNDPNDFDYYYANPKFNDFLILENGLFGKHKYISNCPMCNKGFTRGWILKSGREICECQVEQIILKEKRKEKLIKING